MVSEIFSGKSSHFIENLKKNWPNLQPDSNFAHDCYKPYCHCVASQTVSFSSALLLARGQKLRNTLSLVRVEREPERRSRQAFEKFVKR